MKRFLVVLVGDGNRYLYHNVAGEITKSGEHYLNHMIAKLAGSHHAEQPYLHSTMRYVYEIMYADNRKQIDKRDDLELIYISSVQQYNGS